MIHQDSCDFTTQSHTAQINCRDFDYSRWLVQHIANLRDIRPAINQGKSKLAIHDLVSGSNVLHQSDLIDLINQTFFVCFKQPFHALK